MQPAQLVRSRRTKAIVLALGGVAIILGALLTLGTADAKSPNLLTSGQQSFERAPVGWQSPDVAEVWRTRQYAANGRYSLKVAAINGNWDGTRPMQAWTSPSTQGIPVVPGTSYAGSFKARPWEDFTTDVACELVWFAADGSAINRTAGAWTPEIGNGWVTAGCSGAAPPAAATVALSAQFRGVFRGDAHFLDEASLLATGASGAPVGATGTKGRARPPVAADAAAPTTTVVPLPPTAANLMPAAPPDSAAPGGAPGVEPSLPAPLASGPASTTVTPPPSSGGTSASEAPTASSTTSGPTTTRAAATTRPPTTTRATSTSSGASSTTAPASPSTTGPRTANPQNLGRIDVYDATTLSDVVVDSIFVHGGGQLTATNVKVNGSVVLTPEVGKPKSKLHLLNSTVNAGVTINAIDSAGNLYWGGEVPVDVLIQNTWVNHPQGGGSDHTEALAGFGWPSGARFINSTFIQTGPFNGTATATINWHGTDSTFDGCTFGWSSGVAAYFTVYVEGRNNVVRNSVMEKGMAGYVYPDSTPKASYSGTVDAGTRQAVSL